MPNATANHPTRTADKRTPAHVLVVEHDCATRRSFARTLRTAGYTAITVESGEAALRRLTRFPFEAAVASAFLPDMSGLALLDRARQAAPNTPFVVAVPFGSTPIAQRAMATGAAGIITHPCGPYDLAMAVDRILKRSGNSRRVSHDEPAEGGMTESVLDALLSALQSRAARLYGNAERAAAYALQIAAQMDLSADDMHDLERGALLNSIGLLAIPDRILLKPGPLTDDEWNEVKIHPALGFRMCAPVPALHGAATIILHHHERWDGSGYPDGLVGDEIPLGARILSVANALDAMTSERTYRAARSFAEAREEIRRCAGTQLDPAVVDAFLTTPELRWRQIHDLFED